ncbi:MAG TPA: hypothetical protein VHR16_00530 [Candidatus Limnocylindrales bacterium]|nr:hypothetical protein [Candidatus Limnocylindrales bacterium]
MSALFHVVGTAPVIAHTTFADRGAVLPGAIAVGADGKYQAWVVAFASTPGTQEVHYLSSDDGVAWTEGKDASLAALSDGFGNPGAIPTTVFPDGDGWVMYLTGTMDNTGWDIWRATAPEAAGPWTRSAKPVLTRGASGAWDAGTLDFPSVYPSAAGYTMIYSGQGPGDQAGASIGRATSKDGIAWTKDPEPVAKPGLCGGFDAGAIDQPRVISTADNAVLVYAGYAGATDSNASIGYADSLDDGVTWGCEWPNPALDTATLPTGLVHTVAAFQRGDRLALLVEWLSGQTSDVYLADLGYGNP